MSKRGQNGDKGKVGKLDLTTLATNWFEYSVASGDPPQEVTVKLDTDEVMFTLMSIIPTAFQPIDELVPDGPNKGQPRIGISKIVECAIQGKEIPKNLPNIHHVVYAIRKAFKVPEDQGFKVCMAILSGYIQSVSQLVELKKPTPDSQDSAGHTPA